ncbi:hypothetical protein ASPCADRAFT_1356 [Aspergillus carbonarius ITEM 5010]|uniref:Uncharacterized protein n=1 Tax=Aspergillus carbonarius (strain ITEM 5010) TaxID=602072 RepID=A0A1R3RYX6_ASPC5|nr:hypothetical protein ASPCADRAFT_1356 [Aspergillus carbonarius ITEM 5010]
MVRITVLLVTSPSSTRETGWDRTLTGATGTRTVDCIDHGGHDDHWMRDEAGSVIPANPAADSTLDQHQLKTVISCISVQRHTPPIRPSVSSQDRTRIRFKATLLQRHAYSRRSTTDHGDRS